MRARRVLLGTLSLGLLAGCGFQLRQAPNFVFSTVQVTSSPNSPLGDELRRNLASSGAVRLMDAPPAGQSPDVVLDLLSERREKVVVGVNAAGQVREFQLRSRVSLRLRTPQGRELIPSTELLQQRDVSFNESAVLAKEAEENLLYRDMQSDLVQQIMRRLAAVTSL